MKARQNSNYRVLSVAVLVVLITAATTAAVLYIQSAQIKDCSFTDKYSCSSDSDCICGGIDKETGECFRGNIAYYSRCVDISQQCPDFCTGIAANFETRCVNRECEEVRAGSS